MSDEQYVISEKDRDVANVLLITHGCHPLDARLLSDELMKDRNILLSNIHKYLKRRHRMFPEYPRIRMQYTIIIHYIKSLRGGNNESI